MRCGTGASRQRHDRPSRLNSDTAIESFDPGAERVVAVAGSNRQASGSSAPGLSAPCQSVPYEPDQDEAGLKDEAEAEDANGEHDKLLPERRQALGCAQDNGHAFGDADRRTGAG